MSEVNKNTETTENAAEFFENAEVIQDKISKGEEFAARNKNMMLGLLGLIVLGLAGYMGYEWQVEEQSKAAQLEMFPAVFYFEKDSLNKALNGDGNTTNGFEALASEYSMTPEGELANFYIGVAKLKDKEYDAAIEAFGKVSTDDLLVQARAYCLTGDAYAQKGEFAKAAEFYKKASEYKPNPQFTPEYLLKLGLACEKNNDLQGAFNAYERITKEFSKDNSDLPKAQRAKARVEHLMGAAK